MEPIRLLGDAVEKSWREENYCEDAFPNIASSLLREADLPSKISAWDTFVWTLGQTELPRQMDVHSNFGSPAITLYTAPRFYIDIYFWFQGTTTIHQHRFCGAFQVLLGSSLHSWYEFQRHTAINAFMEIGEMSLKECGLLNVGDVQEIRPGRQYIHSLFHLDHPSATVVVRTGESPLHLPQFNYEKPSLAIDPFFELDTVTKKLQAVEALIRAERPGADKIIGDLLDNADLQTAYYILLQVRKTASLGNLEKIFNINNEGRTFRDLFERVRARHGSNADTLARVFEHREFLQEILIRRSYITDPEQRFFFALLLNVDGKERILELIADRFPGTDPVEKILDWVFDLSQTRLAGAAGQNALGLAEFDEFDMFVLENLLKSRTDSDMREALSDEYTQEQAKDLQLKIDERVVKIRSTPIFKPLLSEVPAAGKFPAGSR